MFAFFALFLFLLLLVHHVPDHLRCGSSLCDVSTSQLGVMLGHLGIGVTEKLRQFVQIAAVHHVSGCEGVTQIVEPEVMDIGSFEQVLKTSFQSLTLAD